MGYQAGPLLRPQNEPAATAAPGSGTWAVVRLMRAENCVLAGLATVVGAGTAAASTSGSSTLSLAASVAAVMLVLAFGNVLNDVADQEGDRLGKPRRPLPAGLVSQHQASCLAAALLAGALGVTLVLAPRQLPLVAAMAAVAALYTPFLKRVPLLGNAVFALQCGATVVFGARSAGGVEHVTVAAALLVTVGILCIEVAKTVEDHAADGQVGIRTVAHLVTPARHRRLVGAFAAAYVVVWAVLWASARHPLVFALAAAPVVPLLVFAATPAGPDSDSPASRVPRFIVASKCLWPLALVALTGL